MWMDAGVVLSHIVFLGCGFAGGLLVGRFARRVVLEESNMETHEVNKRATLSQVLGFATVVLTLLALVSVFFSTQEQQRVTECQARYNEHFAYIVKVRTDAAYRDRQAQIKLSNTMIDLIEISMQPGRTPEERRRVLAQWRAAQGEYSKTLANSDKDRAENQYPLARCG